MTIESPLVDPKLLDGSNSNDSSGPATQSNSSVATAPPADASQSEEADDAEVFDADEYVRDLIARMGGDADKPLSAVPEPVVAEKEPQAAADESDQTMVLSSPEQLKELVAAARNDTANTSGEPSEPREPKPAQPVEAPRRRHAPELLSDLQQLREAANLTTSNALHTFDCKGLVLRSYTSLLMACVAITLCTALLSMSDRPFSIAYTAAVLMFFFGTIATWRYNAATSVLWRKLSR